MADLSAAAFVLQFPEFSEVNTSNPDMVLAALAIGAEQCDAVRWGGMAQKAVFLAAAHDLAMSPHGEMLRLKADPTKSPYGERLKELRRTRALGHFGLAGGLGPYGW